MRLRNPFFLAGVLAFSFGQPAQAVRFESDLPRSSTDVTDSVPVRSGTIISIDRSLNTIVIDAVTYTFSSVSVIVRSSDSSSRYNPLDLAKGERIRFVAQKEPGSIQQRVTEVWIVRK